jgi:hypothetical protein
MDRVDVLPHDCPEMNRTDDRKKNPLWVGGTIVKPNAPTTKPKKVAA